ncbi:glycosyltransferase family 2 protein [Bradyrhizobium jicamae]|uniref:Glycosyltransferase family 2 protein n=1 Tax=Bradyrhizobium jicamae TaxID=280332 RepID=A0ABS5FK58_9BRAD|nr:glycosyltransferase family 2 protein [Bradyrhizobium jicamae]MBR0797141.1 glycosyltransferase family 2 protein [Bradyrhizobium jicamae]
MITSILRSLVGRFNKLDVIQFGLRGMLLPSKVKHLHGPIEIGGDANDVIVISVMRNSEAWLKSFLFHHRRMGVRHFVIIDNGSTDASVGLLSQQPDVTLLQTDAPYHAYENTMKRYLAERFCSSRWCLCVDADERFDFPGSSRIGLTSLINYLSSRGFNAVVTQMLDMFSDRPISDARIDGDGELIEQYPFYDLSDIAKTPYQFGRVSNPAIMTHRGGIRKTVFGTNNGLSKVSLFLMDGKIKPFIAWHHALHARLADISCVLLHFPFTESFGAKVAEAVRSGRYGYLTTDEYVSYLDGFQQRPRLTLKRDSAVRFARVDELLGNGFLVASDDYRRWVVDHAERRSATTDVSPA